MKTLERETTSPEETTRLGERLGSALRPGDVIGLDGDLGAGKTCLVRGLARGLALDPDVVYSPSFTLVAEHPGPIPLHHIDLFRLGEPVEQDEAEEIGLREYLDSSGVTAVEWASRLAPGLASFTVRVAIEDAGSDRRIVRLTADGPRGEAILRSLGAD